MAIPNTTPLTAPVAPLNEADNYASHLERFQEGGYRSVADLTARDAIPTNRRKEHMLVYVVSNDTVYTLSGGVTNGDWAEQDLINKTLLDQIERNSYTGWIQPPNFAVNGGDNTKFDVTVAGTGIVMDFTDPSNPVKTVVTLGTQTGIPATLLGSVTQTFIVVNSAGTIEQLNSIPDDETGDLKLVCGNFTHGDGASPPNDILDFYTNTPFTSYANDSVMRAFLSSLGGINIDGLEFSGATGVGNEIKLAHTAGRGIRIGGNSDTDDNIPHRITASAEAISGFVLQVHEDLSGTFITTTNDPEISSTQYRDPTTGNLVAMTSNYFQIMRIFFFYGSNSTLVYFGNAEYSTKDLAIQGINTETFNENFNTKQSVFRGYLIIQEGCTDLSDIGQAEFRIAGGIRPFGNTPGSTQIVTLQKSYENSTANPEIELNLVNGGVTLRTPSGSDDLVSLEVQKNSGSTSFSVDGEGTTIANSYDNPILFSDDFEAGDFATGGWVTVNDSPNVWIVNGTDALTGSFSAYISNNSTNNQYTNTTSAVSHIYKDIVIPSEIGNLIIEFDMQCAGENDAGLTQWDYGKTFLTDTTFTPVAGTEPTVSGTVRQIGRYKYVDSPTTEHVVIAINENDLANVVGTTQRLIFTWKNDSSIGVNPPFNIDNVVVRAGDLKDYILSEFEVRMDFDTQSSNTGVETTITWDNERQDRGSEITTTTFTASRSGSHLFTGNLHFQLNTGGTAQIRLYRGSTLIASGSDSISSSGTVYPSLSKTIYLNKGDTIQVRGFQASGSSATIQLGSNFSGVYLGV